MLDLRQRVLIRTIDGDKLGTIVGRSRQEHPHYDVQTNAGIILNLPCDQVRALPDRKNIFAVQS